MDLVHFKKVLGVKCSIWSQTTKWSMIGATPQWQGTILVEHVRVLQLYLYLYETFFKDFFCIQKYSYHTSKRKQNSVKKKTGYSYDYADFLCPV